MRAFLVLGIFALGLVSTDAESNIGQEFGFGARSQALAGATVAWGFDAFAAYSNPAGISLASGDEAHRLSFSIGMIYMNPGFTPINNVVTSNSFTGDPTVVTGNVDTSYKETFGQYIGLTYDLFPEFHKLSLGIVTFLPIEQTAYIDSGETYVPEYFLYRARTQRPQIEVGAGMDLGRGYHVGAGLHTGFNLTTSGSVFLKTTPGQPSTMRFTSSVTPQFAPYLGFLYAPVSNPEKFSLGAVVRFPLTYNSVINFNSGSEFFGGLAAIPFNFAAASALYYDPTTIEVGGSLREGYNWRTNVQLDYELWGGYTAPDLVIQNTSVGPCSGGCTSSLSPSVALPFQYQNILVPRIGEEWDISPFVTLRAGYSYRASVLSSVSNDTGNYLDPPKHILNMGAGLHYLKFLGYNAPTTIDLDISYQQLVTQHIVKTANDEAGSSSEQKVGAPGYDAGGNVYGANASLTVSF